LTLEESSGNRKDQDYVIGKTTATENSPNTVADFAFWLAPDKIVNPFDFVTADHLRGTKTIGIVREMMMITDAPSHLSNYVSSEFGTVTTPPNTTRVSTTIARASVMANTGIETKREGISLEINMPIENDQPVRFATASEVSVALGAEKIRQPVPMGLIEMSNGVSIPVYVDGRYLLGPEAAHLNVSGISGLATKTSYMMFLIQSILKAYGREKLGVVMFNVKQQDLLHIHEEATDLAALDYEIYKSLGIEAKPFADVTYFLPRGPDGEADSEHEPENSKVYAYSLRDCVSDTRSSLDLLLSEVRDPDYTIASILEHVRERWPLRFGKDLERDGQTIRTADQHVETWEDLRLYDNYPKEIRLGSRGKFRRHLARLTNSDLFVARRKHEVYLGDEVKKLKGGQVCVIDIFRTSRVEERAAFVIGDVMRSLEEMYAEEIEGRPKKVIVVVDELNKYAPKGTMPGPVAQQIIEIARTGRSRGTILFGAEQFKSEAHEQVYENAGTHLIGRTGSSELSTQPYSFLDKETKGNVTRLEQGELVLVHAAFRQPVKIVFPCPSYKRQESATSEARETESTITSKPDGSFSES
jgi:DNA helicase HerA-like ATPase